MKIFLRLNDTKTKVPKKGAPTDTISEARPKPKRGRPKKETKEKSSSPSEGLGAEDNTKGKEKMDDGEPVPPKPKPKRGRPKKEATPKTAKESVISVEGGDEGVAIKQGETGGSLEGGKGEEPEHTPEGKDTQSEKHAHSEPEHTMAPTEVRREEEPQEGIMEVGAPTQNLDTVTEEPKKDQREGGGESERKAEEDRTLKEEEFDILYEKDIVDINCLWQLIIDDWRTVCPSIADPIIHIVLLMTL